MIIHGLSVSGFKMIGESLEISFPEGGGIGIFGPNETGKSTLLESIEYALYGLKKGRSPGETREDVVTWGKEKSEFGLEFTSGENRYLVLRSIGSKSGHKAALYVLIDGKRELLGSTTDGVAKEVERITGMDRDTFTKLVYIKQKDLDALKDLSKANREALINKVMGMEVFDESLRKINDNLKELRSEKAEKDLELEAVRKNKLQYESDLNSKNELVKEISEIEPQLAEKKSRMEASKDDLNKYEWLYKKISNDDILEEKRKSLQSAEKSFEEWTALKRTLETHTSALDKFKPKFEELDDSLNRFSELEGNLRRLKKELKGLNAEKEREVAQSGLSLKEIERLTQDLQSKKRSRLSYAFLTLILGVVFLVAGIVTGTFLWAIALPFAVIFVILFVTFQKLDRLSGLHLKVQTIIREIGDKRREFESVDRDMKSLRMEDRHQSSEQVKREKEGLQADLERETGTKSIEGLEALLRSNKERERGLAAQNLQSKIEEAKREIGAKQIELDDLLKNKPSGVDTIKYSERAHQRTRKAFAEAEQQFNELKEPHDIKKGELRRLDAEITRLKPDYDRFPIIEKESNDLQSRVAVRDRVIVEIKETSRELRSKVLPYAGFIINNILPTITNGRYSDLAITEDLKFNVHSMEAGAYKEREVFSGGTQDQFLIALRLAFTESILDSRVKADYYSLLMDECISSSDEARKQGIFEVLELMKKTFRQLFIVAHEDISRFVDHHLVLMRDDNGYTRVRSRSW